MGIQSCEQFVVAMFPIKFETDHLTAGMHASISPTSSQDAPALPA